MNRFFKTAMPILVIVIMLITQVAFSCASENGPIVKLVVADDRNLHHLNLYVAQELGIFKKHGLDVTIVDVRNAAASRDLVLSGQADIFWACPTVAIMSVSNGAALKIIAQAKTPCGSVLVVSKGSLIRTAADLKGKRISGLSPTCEGVIAYQKKARSSGGEFTVVVQNGGRAIADLKAGRIDGAILEEPHLSLAEQSGFRPVLRDAAKIFPCRTINARTAALKESPEAFRRFVKAIAESNAIIRRNPVSHQIITIAGKYTAIPEKVLKTALAHLHFSEKIDQQGIARLTGEMTATAIIRDNPSGRLYAPELKQITWGSK